MATSVTAISEPFSPTTATVSQPSGTATAGSTSGSIINLQSTYSIGPTGGASGTSGGSTTQTLSCSSCCVPLVYYLPTWFSSYGLCPGAVDNTVPVTLTATFTLSGYGGYTLADMCLPTSASIDVIADDPVRPSNLYIITPSTTCSLVSPPTTRFNVKSPLANPYDWVFTAAYNTAHQLLYSLTLCNCSTSFALNLSNWAFLNANLMTLASSSCSPFSITFTGGTIYETYIRKGSFEVTFTL